MCEEGSESKFGSEEELNVFRTLDAAREGAYTLGMGGLDSLHVVHWFSRRAQFDPWIGDY